MKKIYIVLTYTGTFLSKIIKLWTKDEFSHVSIALDENLDQMYSFGRIHAYNPLYAGFVHEGINIGTFKRFKRTQALIYSLEITQEQYLIIRNEILNFKKYRKKYSFNMIGLLAVGFNKKVHLKHSFYCAEFVKYLLETANILTNLPDIVKPEDFKKIKGYEVIYKGKLRKYNKEKFKEYISNYIEICAKRKKEAV